MKKFSFLCFLLILIHRIAFAGFPIVPPSTLEPKRLNAKYPPIGDVYDDYNHVADFYVWAQDNKLYIHIYPIKDTYVLNTTLGCISNVVIQNNISREIALRDEAGQEYFYNIYIFAPQTYEIIQKNTEVPLFDPSQPLVFACTNCTGNSWVWKINGYEYTSDCYDRYDDGYEAGRKSCIDDPLSCGIGQFLIFSNSANPVLQSGAIMSVYGNDGLNKVTLKSGAAAKLINFVGENEVTIKADSTLFSVSRSGAAVTIEDFNGTVLTIPATKTPQNIIFNDIVRTLVIDDNQVMLGTQIVNLTPNPIL